MRREYKRLRNGVDKRERTRLSSAICKHATKLEAYAAAQHVLCYASIGSEVETKTLLVSILQSGRTLLLPVTGEQQMQAAVVRSLDTLQTGRFGILEPADAQYMEPGKIDLVFVPGLAFQRSGYRLGYGGGYYDRFLLHCPQAARVGLAYHMQLCDVKFEEAYDQKLNKIVTEQGVIACE